MGPLLFLLQINDLPKEVNKTSAPIIFVDVLYIHSNLIDFNNNIPIVFETLNEWFKANQLSLNFNKTNYRHSATKRNMSINLKIGLNNNLTTNRYHTKFLGLTMDCKLSRNNHIDLFMTKLSTACYIIRNVKTYTSASALKIICLAFFHSAMSYGIIFWGNSSYSSTIFACKRRQLELWKNVGIEFHVETYFRN